MTDQDRGALRALLQQWRDAAFDAQLGGTHGEHRAMVWNRCANELESLLSRRAEPALQCEEGTCNPYIADCGTEFCTFDEMAEHNQICEKLKRESEK
jgi:hypothetical protein